MNDLDRIYKELGPDICLYPFFGAFYSTTHVVAPSVTSKTSSVKPCCIVQSDNRQKWSITNDLHQSRNNVAWKKMRDDFINGRYHSIADCASCQRNEQQGATSPRLTGNQFLSEFLDFDIVDKVNSIVANANTVDNIYTLDYFPSNYCNYACIMCTGPASSQRQTFEIKVLNYKTRTIINEPDNDFYTALEKCKIIKFTGGETVLQSEVHKVLDYLIEKNLAQDIVIFLLTNASDSHKKLSDKFSKFKQVVYNVSIDGIGPVIEYQRRGCKWNTVEQNSKDLLSDSTIGTVINYVLTAVNVFSFIDFVDWAHSNGIGPKFQSDMDVNFINISPVFGSEYLGQSAIPPQLKEVILFRLQQGKNRYQSYDTVIANYYVRLIEQVINIVTCTEFSQTSLTRFITHIQKEDVVSKKKLAEVVPEWEPYLPAL